MPLCTICWTRIEWGQKHPAADDLCRRCGWLLAWFHGYFHREYTELRFPIGIETRFIDLRIDSLDYVEWVLEAEQTFGVTISDREAERCITVGDFLHLLARKTWKQGDPPVDSPPPSRVFHPLWDEDLDR